MLFSFNFFQLSVSSCRGNLFGWTVAEKLDAGAWVWSRKQCQEPSSGFTSRSKSRPLCKGLPPPTHPPFRGKAVQPDVTAAHERTGGRSAEPVSAAPVRSAFSSAVSSPAAWEQIYLFRANYCSYRRLDLHFKLISQTSELQKVFFFTLMNLEGVGMEGTRSCDTRTSCK